MLQQSGNLTDAEKAEIMEEQLASYSPPSHLDKIMPTRIGNIMRTSELYAYDRYGIDPVIFWTRLRPLLSEEVVAPLADSKTARDFMLLMSIHLFTVTVIWCPILALFTNRWILFLLCSLGWPLAWICYQSAVQSATAYSEQIKAIFDLHRYELFKAFNLPIPEDGEEERQLWKVLANFLYYNIPMSSVPFKPDEPQGWDQVATALAEYIKRITPSTQ